MSAWRKDPLGGAVGCNASTIKRSLSNRNLLGSFFQDESAALQNINIAQALLIEFLTRIGNRGKLFDYLKWFGIPIRLCEAFVEGLYWRDLKSVNKRTARWISRFLSLAEVRDSTLNVLVAPTVRCQIFAEHSRSDNLMLKVKIMR